MALSKANRLQRRQDFDRVYQRGKRFWAKHLYLVMCSSRSDASLSNRLRNPVKTGGELISQDQIAPSVRVGISISRKVSKRAVVRNRVKRRIRAIIRGFLPRMRGDRWIIIVVKPSVVDCDYGQIFQELEQLMIEAEVLHGS